jgi:hypothetical protein
METQQEEYYHCKGCKCRRHIDEFEIYKGQRRKSCLKCKAKRERNKEQQKQYKQDNKEQIAEQKKQYREENKQQIAEYNKQYNQNNKDKIAERNKKYREDNKDYDKQYYEENKDEILEKRKQYRENNKQQIADRNKQYRENNKQQISERQKIFYEKNKCEHNKERRKCKICNLQLYLVNIQRHAVKRVLKQSNLTKTKHTIEYLGCDSEYFKNYIQNKMTDEMTFENIHIDHVKPVSQFNLNDEEQFLDCCHYTNLQPLLAKDNLEKNNKWTYVNEIYWIENIKGKETTDIYFSWK